MLGTGKFFVRTADVLQSINAAGLLPSSQEKPVIVFGVCDAGEAIGDTHFPSILGDFGAQVIAPRTEITEGFAVEFIREIDFFLRSGLTPARALLATRWHMLVNRNDPLGLVYALFGP
ncbi:hypothetical protein J5X84_41225 [Streptosporangiaceae bacterium NEAU-GS5]|nr:hypothetical protein [Streptosporangiaceae bacterium NEAU-GS5]